LNPRLPDRREGNLRFRQGSHAVDAGDPYIDNDRVPNELDVRDCTLPSARVVPDGGVLGDLDADCDVDLEDFVIMQSRFTGLGRRPPIADLRGERVSRGSHRVTTAR
jgi:hypothetical protein